MFHPRQERNSDNGENLPEPKEENATGEVNCTKQQGNCPTQENAAASTQEPHHANDVPKPENLANAEIDHLVHTVPPSDVEDSGPEMEGAGTNDEDFGVNFDQNWSVEISSVGVVIELHQPHAYHDLEAKAMRNQQQQEPHPPNKGDGESSQ